MGSKGFAADGGFAFDDADNVNKFISDALFELPAMDFEDTADTTNDAYSAEDDTALQTEWSDNIPALAMLKRMMNSEATEGATPATQPAISGEQAYAHHIKAGDFFLKHHFELTQPCNMLGEALNAYCNAAEHAQTKEEEVNVLVKRAMVLLHQGKISRATELVERADAIQKNNSGVATLQGLISFKLGQPQAALKHFENARASQATHASEANKLLAGSSDAFYLAKSYRLNALRLGNGFKAYSQTAKSGVMMAKAAAKFVAEQLQPNTNAATPGVKLSWGQWNSLISGLVKIRRFQQKEQPEQALSEAYALYMMFPGFAPLMVLIGQLYESGNKRTEAVIWYQKALARDPLYDEALYCLADLMDTCEAPEAALELYSLLLERQPGHPVWQTRAGQACYRLGDLESAANHLQIALLNSADAGNPYSSVSSETRVTAAYELARIYERYQNIDGAILAIQHAVQAEPANAKHYMKLGLLHFDKQDTAGAKAVYEQALRFNPTDAPTHANLGYLAWLDGDVPTSMSYYERAIALDDQYEIPLNNLGAIYLDQFGQAHKALGYFKKAIAINDEYAVAHYNLGRAYGALGQPTLAAKALQAAERLNADTQELDSEDIFDCLNNLFMAS
ncbi:MAG: tetratricopeptide repeat protein [Vampirovibrionales bacterium]|nr:tetratricopeptide repeat protein [Vampirovibrionales bacterium]